MVINITVSLCVLLGMIIGIRLLWEGYYSVCDPLISSSKNTLYSRQRVTVMENCCKKYLIVQNTLTGVRLRTD